MCFVFYQALFCTGNKSAEIAIDYIFNNPGEVLNTSAGSTEAVKNSSNESGKLTSYKIVHCYNCLISVINKAKVIRR